MLAMHLLIASVSFISFAFVIQVAWKDEGAMRVFLFFVALFMVLFGYLHAVPLFFWPCGLVIDRDAGRIFFRYLLFKKTVALSQLERCVVTEAINRYPYETYLLFLKKGAVITLSDLTISQFPGPFAYNVRLDVSDRLPRFIPGFRWLCHRK